MPRVRVTTTFAVRFMTVKVVHIFTIFFSLLAFCAAAEAQEVFSGTVRDAQTGEPVPGAAVTQGKNWAITDSLGVFSLKTHENTSFTITCLGYKTLEAAPEKRGVYRLQPDIFALQEVVVTAQENHGLTSSSKIGQEAISHIQPSSIADLLELLPGGVSRDPAFGSPKVVNLRAAGSLSSDYATSALGTRFTVDGKPVLNEANLQYTPAYSSLGSDYVNLGTDMRTIATEEIETMDVVRGIASVEHGDLTSGLIQIKRRRGGNDVRLRFKSDMSSKLFYAGKGWEWGEKDKSTLNIGANYLDSHSDPRNLRQNYKRVTASVRGSYTWNGNPFFRSLLTASLDYTGSFDNQKSDRDIDEFDGIPAETYKSTNNHLDLGADWTLSVKNEESVFRSVVLTGSLNYGHDVIDRWKNVILTSEEPISVSRVPGEFDAAMVPTRYEASLIVDGKPFYAYLRAVSRWRLYGQNLMAGAEWTFSKNFGNGSVFDVMRPFSTGSDTRPRAYKEIPADNNLAFFIEENGKASLRRFSLEWSVGVRAGFMPGLSRNYALSGKWAVDPRANLRINFPETIVGGYKLETGLYGGIGVHTKFPTMDMLYPALQYRDKIQLNYWPVEKELRRINYLVYTIDTTPYQIGAARNLKWEVGADASWNGWSASVDFFTEDMTSGFRGGSDYMRVVAKDYDERVIDKSSLTGPPSVENLPYVLDTNLVAYGLVTNGSRTLKRGVEYTLASPRIPVVNTRITVNGAWFRTRYMNSQPEWERPSVIINGKNYPYIGLYDKNDSRMYDSFNTNFMLDTQIPRLGLIFSASFQCTWFTGQQNEADDSRPVAYLDKDLQLHPFTDESDADGVLHRMVRVFSPTLLEYRREPFYMNVNLKISKTLFKGKAVAALFVNRLFTVAPDYEINGVIRRRSSTPYFGMEISFKI